jgi:hypothetical protein
VAECRIIAAGIGKERPMIDWTKPVQALINTNWVDVIPLFTYGKDIPSHFTLKKYSAEVHHPGTAYLILQDTNLRNVPPKKVKKEGWMNVFHIRRHEHDQLSGGGIYDTEESALKYAVGYAVATVRIEWEEDQ